MYSSHKAHITETMAVVTDIIFGIFDHVMTSTLDQINIEIRSSFANFKISIADDANAFLEIKESNHKNEEASHSPSPTYRFLYDTNVTRIKRKMFQDFRESIINDNGTFMTYNDVLKEMVQSGPASIKVSVLDQVNTYEQAVPDHVRREFERVFTYDVQMDSVETVF